MKIKRLTLYGYGKFANQSFDLDGTMTTFYGQNEAGKSTIAQFIPAILFGFPSKRSADLRHEPLTGGRYGGELIIEKQGQEFRVQRESGPKRGRVTLTALQTGLQLPPETLTDLIAPLDEALYETVFFIDEPRLAQVFSLKPDQLTYLIQGLGAAGSEEWQEYEHQLEHSARDLYKPTGRNPVINQQLGTRAELVDRIEQSKAVYPQFVKAVDQQHQSNERLKDLETTVHQANQELNELQVLESKWPTYNRLTVLTDQQTNHTVGFSRDDEQELQHLLVRLDDLKTQQQDLQAELAQAKGQTPQQMVGYATHQERFDSLAAELAQMTQVALQIERDQSNQRNQHEEYQALLDRYSVGGQVPRPFTRSDDQLVSELLNQQRKLRQRQQTMQNQLNAANEQGPRTRTTQRQPVTRDLLLIGVGLGLLLVALFMPSMAVKLVGACIGLGIAAYAYFGLSATTSHSLPTDQVSEFWAQLRENNRDAQAVTDQLDQIGIRYGLTALDPEQWSSIQRDLNRLQQLQREIQDRGQFPQRIVIEDYLQQWQTVMPELKFSDQMSYSNQLQAVSARVDRIRSAAQSEQSTVSLLTQLRRQEQQLSGQVERQVSQVNQFLRNRGVETADQFNAQVTVERDREVDQTELRRLSQQLSADDLKHLAQYKTRQELQTQLETVQNRSTQLQQQQTNTVHELAELAAKIEAWTTNGLQTDLEQQLAALDTEIIANVEKYLSHQFAARWIDQMLALASQDRLPEIIQLAEGQLALLTKNRYTQIKLSSEQIEIKGEQTPWLTVGHLSRGTAEQLYVCLKLAVARVLSESHRLPLVIDDGFVTFDDQRRQMMSQLLTDVGQQLQVILLTSDAQAAQTVNQNQLIKL
ncbi:ATP-binding protein [Levilactobacillus bambusae]|nr:AAA family ATPase [Levilactobacillus bambusae]